MSHQIVRKPMLKLAGSLVGWSDSYENQRITEKNWEPHYGHFIREVKSARAHFRDSEVLGENLDSIPYLPWQLDETIDIHLQSGQKSVNEAFRC